MQAGFKGHQTRKDLKSKANEKEDTSKRDHEGSVKIESKIKKSKTFPCYTCNLQVENLLYLYTCYTCYNAGLERRSSDISVTLTMDLTETPAVLPSSTPGYNCCTTRYIKQDRVINADSASIFWIIRESRTVVVCLHRIRIMSLLHQIRNLFWAQNASV